MGYIPSWSAPLATTNRSSMEQLPEANPATVAVGAAALVLLILLPRWNQRVAAGPIVLFGSIVLSSALEFDAVYGVQILIHVLPGMLIGLVCSLLVARYRSSLAHVSTLGSVRGKVRAYSDVTRHPGAVPVPGLLILKNSPCGVISTSAADARTARDGEGAGSGMLIQRARMDRRPHRWQTS